MGAALSARRANSAARSSCCGAEVGVVAEVEVVAPSGAELAVDCTTSAVDEVEATGVAALDVGAVPGVEVVAAGGLDPQPTPNTNPKIRQRVARADSRGLPE